MHEHASASVCAPAANKAGCLLRLWARRRSIKSVIQKVLEDLDLISLLSHFDEGSNVDRGPLELNDVIGAVHVDEDLFLLELSVLIPADIVREWLLGSAKVASKHQKLALLVILVQHFNSCPALSNLWTILTKMPLFLRDGVQQAPVDSVLPAKLICRVDREPLFSLDKV